MTLSVKLQLRHDTSVVVLGRPEGLELDLPVSTDADAILAFVTNAAELDTTAAPAIEAARGDGLAWIAYPKAGQLGTDLDRDILAALGRERGIQPVRQVSIDAVWSALRFRPLER
jgi:hypothetical protein